MRASRLLMSAVLLAFIAPEVSAQVPGVNLQLVPKIGAYLPANDLGEARAGAQQIKAEMAASLAIGLAAELDLPLSPVNLRFGFDYATGAEVSGEGISSDEELETTVLALTGDLVFRPLPRLVVVQPYLLGGAGIKVYDFDSKDVTDQDLSSVFEDDENDFALHLGAGVDIKLFRNTFLLVEVSDYISRFKFQDSGDDEIQNDIFGMAGLRVGLF